jgi:hypothetical protein
MFKRDEVCGYLSNYFIDNFIILLCRVYRVLDYNIAIRYYILANNIFFAPEKFDNYLSNDASK